MEAWDGVNPPDYVSPVEPGDRVVLRRDGTLVQGTVARVEGYLPGVVELEHNLRVDLVGWDLAVVRRPLVVASMTA